MPTARELLEQADALMRRNRTSAMDDIPVLTDSVSVVRGPRKSAPESRAPAARAADAIPTLTESVSKSLDDPQDSLMPEGEPSDWLDLDAGEPSITGDAPDSIAIVPEVELPRRDDEALIQSAEHEEIELTTPEDDSADDDLDALLEEDEEEPQAEDEEAPQALAAEPAPEPEPEPASPVAEIEVAESEAADVQMDAPVEEFPEAFMEVMPVSSAIPVVEPGPQPVPEPEALPPQEHDLAAFAALGHVQIDAAEAMPPVHVESAVLAAAPAAVAPVVDEQARWDAMAEEIRSQVLQRIDLFTDTGLREQLGSRLKPIVDRASADLVTTINTHVGELLRAYVAEAIEREIESWRKDH